MSAHRVAELQVKGIEAFRSVVKLAGVKPDVT
jgi:hypothetical protein